MQPITGFCSYVHHRLGSTGLLLILVLAVAAIAVVTTATVIMGSLAIAADPVQIAPLRWGSRHF